MATPLKSQHFLVIENDAQEAALLNAAFQGIPDCGTVAIARNISEAKAYLKGAGVYSDRRRFQFPSTILSSYRVDGDSGVDLLAWVKADPELRRVPFVLLVPASAPPAEIAEAKIVGSVRVAKKPRNSSDLQGMLERLAAALCTNPPEVCSTDF